MRMHYFILMLLVAGLATGCAATDFGPGAENGLIVYVPGAGNVDRGEIGLQKGLDRLGYRGAFVTLHWTYSYNIMIDQSVRAFARLASKHLASVLQEYEDRYPGREVNIVGLSAGTAISVWALEDLRPEYRIKNLVLLSGSLSYDYDVSRALERIDGKIYNYYSMTDAVLIGAMKFTGTLDGKLLTDGIGAVGFEPPFETDRIVNTPWTPDFEKYGYLGGHLDVTAPDFVEHFIAPQITSPSTLAKRDGAAATLAGSAAPAGSPN